jgi:hypothetical protein
MIVFRVVHVHQSREAREEGWAVERSEPDGLKIMVTRLYPIQAEAEREAKRLNDEAAKRTMR